MKLFNWLAAAALVAVSVSANAKDDFEPTYVVERGAVTVTWQDHKEYRDVRAANDIQSRFAKRAFDRITKQLEKDARPVLKEGQTLHMTVTELDLAGDVRPTFGAGPNEIRLIEGIYPPRITFTYQVKEGDNVVVEGEQDIKDLGFDTKMRTPQANHNTFYYEGRMLKEWLRKTVQPALEQG
ncbi:DUF3016 domain-containing protein [Paraferrimonas sedimenticola]|uniref:DUF3016 domain-containing protein n=1 Tax=Paraferrimonas sedimenticola TaxID=375674 RepID=A0AA37RY93_9GAMM|nr:DUF3016 domain-containing protein [Paraferrimonas sedimenticola]GLP97291.1 hypothetical protein GCM10007895_25980 [Paraferrimonas sedimenticola]